MQLGEVERLRGELSEFVADVFASLPRRDQRGWGGRYLRGPMLGGRRKSIQPMAERLSDGNMQALQQLVNQSPWGPLPVRRWIAECLCGAVGPHGVGGRRRVVPQVRQGIGGGDPAVLTLLANRCLPMLGDPLHEGYSMVKPGSSGLPRPWVSLVRRR
jgi:hypothetical protein